MEEEKEVNLEEYLDVLQKQQDRAVNKQESEERYQKYITFMKAFNSLLEFGIEETTVLIKPEQKDDLYKLIAEAQKKDMNISYESNLKYLHKNNRILTGYFTINFEEIK